MTISVLVEKLNSIYHLVVVNNCTNSHFLRTGGSTSLAPASSVEVSRLHVSRQRIWSGRFNRGSKTKQTSFLLFHIFMWSTSFDSLKCSVLDGWRTSRKIPFHDWNTAEKKVCNCFFHGDMKYPFQKKYRKTPTSTSQSHNFCLIQIFCIYWAPEPRTSKYFDSQRTSIHEYPSCSRLQLDDCSLLPAACSGSAPRFGGNKTV